MLSTPPSFRFPYHGLLSNSTFRPLLFSTATPLLHHNTPYLTHRALHAAHFKNMTSTKAYPRLHTCILPSFNPARYMCCVCVCVCVCVYCGEVAASISSLANWCMVLCRYIYICKCTNVHIKIVWVCCIHPAQLQTLRVIDFMFSGLSLLCCRLFRQACCCRD